MAGARPAAKPKSSAADKRQSATIELEGTSKNALGSTTGAFGGRKGLQQTVLNQYLIGLGGSKEEVKGVNDTIVDLIEKARDKQDDAMFERGVGSKGLTEQEMIAALKKVEIKFHELALRRKAFEFFQGDKLRGHEQKIRQQAKNLKTKGKQEKLRRIKEKTEARLQQRIEEKKNLVVTKSIRTTHISRKETKKTKKDDTKKEPPEWE